MTIDDSIKKAIIRLRRQKTIGKMIFGEFNYNRISSYPRLGSVTHKGSCFKCNREEFLIHFDNETHLCENCASESGLLEFA